MSSSEVYHFRLSFSHAASAPGRRPQRYREDPAAVASSSRLRVWVEMPAAAPRPATERDVSKFRLARGASLLRQASVDNVGAQALRLIRHERFVRYQMRRGKVHVNASRKTFKNIYARFHTFYPMGASQKRAAFFNATLLVVTRHPGGPPGRPKIHPVIPLRDLFSALGTPAKPNRDVLCNALPCSYFLAKALQVRHSERHVSYKTR